MFPRYHGCLLLTWPLKLVIEIRKGDSGSKRREEDKRGGDKRMKWKRAEEKKRKGRRREGNEERQERKGQREKIVCLRVKKHENKPFLQKSVTTQFHRLSINHSVEHTTCSVYQLGSIISLLNTA